MVSRRAGASFSRAALEPLTSEFDVPDAVAALACVVAPLPLVPYRYLRWARRTLLPAVSAGVEGGLTSSALVASCGTCDFVLVAEARRTALEILRHAYDVEVSDSEWLDALQSASHSAADGLSPLLRVETELAWDFVTIQDESDLTSAVDERFRNILWTVVYEDRTGILDWLHGAQARLPPECVRGESAWLLSQISDAIGLKMSPVPIPARLSAEGLHALVAHRLPTWIVGIRREPGFIEFGPPNSEHPIGVAVIDTSPRVLWVGPPNGDPLTEVRLSGGQVTRIPCEDGMFTIRNLAGQTFTLRPLEGHACPEMGAADRAIDDARGIHIARRATPATVVRKVAGGYVVTLDDTEVTAFMPSRLSVLHAQDELMVRIERISPSNRRVIVRAVDATVTALRRPGEGSLLVPKDMVPRSVRAGDSASARLIRHGRVRAGGRSAHIFVDPSSPLGHIQFHHRPGYLRFPLAVNLVDDQWFPPAGADMVVEAVEVLGKKWMLHLSPHPGGSPTTAADPIGPGLVLTAEVVSVADDGVRLETREGNPLWMPRDQVHPRVAPDEPLPLVRGEDVVVRVLGFVWNTAPALPRVSQRATAQPFIDRIQPGTPLSGEAVAHRPNGAWVIRIDAVPGISDEPFLATARATDVAGGVVSRCRVVAEAGLVERSQWILRVLDVRREIS